MPSTVIKRYSYDAKAQELRIEFRSGSAYIYEKVPRETYEGLQAAFSKGEYFIANIRDQYEFRREFQSDGSTVRMRSA